MSDAEAQAASDPSPEPTLEALPEQALELAPELTPGDTTESSTESSIESPSDDPADNRFECLSCGFVYDPAEGIKKLKIAAGIPFLELDPASFRCPVCRSKMGAFKDIGPRNKPSGFEENLNFGLGVNRLTPGQKNVLIFGGFALAVAFFLSLYSLR
jgi:rubredoxin